MAADDPHRLTTRPPIKAPPRAARGLLREVQRLARASGALDPDLIEIWPDIVGAELARACRPVRIKRQKNAETLVVAVPNGAAAMQVQYRQAEIIAQVKSRLGRGRLTRLAIEQSGQPVGADATDAPGAGRARWRSPTLKSAPAPSPPPARSVEEALARLRAALGLPPGDET